MRIDLNTDLARAIAPVLALGAGLWSVPAHAEWETVHGAAIAEGASCPAPHDRDPKLRNSDNRPLVIPAGFDNDIEVYGQLIDLSPSATLSARGTASKKRVVRGPVNSARGCGNIGSIVVHINVPYGTQPGTATLAIGSERIPVTVITPTITGTEWSPQSLRGGSTLPAGAPPRAPVNNVHSGPVVSSPGTGCQQNGVGCSNGSGATMPTGAPSGGGAASLDDPPRLPDALGGCIDELGGSATISGRTLTVLLPAARSEQFDIPCLTRPVYFDVTMADGYRGDIGGFRAGTNQPYPDRGKAVIAPRFTGHTAGLTGPTVLDDPNRDFQSIRMTAEIARSFVGDRSIVLTPTAGSGASAVTLILRTDPANGIGNVEGVPFAGARNSSTIPVRFDFVAPARAGGEAVFWRLRAVAGSNPANCFSQISGNLNTSATIGSFQLTATERAGCAGARFELQIGPGRNGSGVFDAPFGRSVTFTLPERAALVPQQPRLPPRS